MVQINLDAHKTWKDKNGLLLYIKYFLRVNILLDYISCSEPSRDLEEGNTFYGLLRVVLILNCFLGINNGGMHR